MGSLVIAPGALLQPHAASGVLLHSLYSRHRCCSTVLKVPPPYRPAVPPCCTARPQVATEYSVKCSYLELYNEEITDLLTVGADVPKVRSQGRRQGRWAGHGGQRGIVHGSVALCLGVNAKT